jgi:hypothetical protein
MLFIIKFRYPKFKHPFPEVIFRRDNIIPEQQTVKEKD